MAGFSSARQRWDPVPASHLRLCLLGDPCPLTRLLRQERCRKAGGGNTGEMNKQQRPESRKPPDDAQEESKRILERAHRDSETIGTSSMARTADRVSDHFKGSENPEDDKIEIWGKRIGRLLGLIAVIALTIHLVTTYILPQ